MGLLFDVGGEARTNKFLSRKAARNLGKGVGSLRTSVWDWRALKINTLKTGVQRTLHCRCRREKMLALGFCGTCYAMKRQDDRYFGGL